MSYGGDAVGEPLGIADWEWVGDGGTNGAPPVRADVMSLLPSPTGKGYSTVTGLGDESASKESS